jgi:hypothetical protein
MASNAEWIIGAFIVGIFIGLLLANDVNSFGVEVAPNSTYGLCQFEASPSKIDAKSNILF